MTRNWITVILVTLLGGTWTGCSGMSQPFPAKEFYAVEVGDSPTVTAQQNKGTVRVRLLRIAQPYDGQSFVYRCAPQKYKTDYYHGFVASPDQLLTGELVTWLTKSKAFAVVLDSGGEGEHQYILDGCVSELCGDYSNNDAKAVVAAKFFLLDDSKVNAQVLFQKTYRREAALSAQTPDALAAGFGAAYRQILADLAADLCQVKAPTENSAGQ